MTKVVYTPLYRPGRSATYLPVHMFRDLWRRHELIWTIAKRDFTATYRSTFLGAAWTLLSPLILLALFTFVFGYVFHGRFSPNPNESPLEFALALFVGLSLYLCVGSALTQSPSLLMGNAVYVKNVVFPLEVLPASQVVILMLNLLIGLGLCQLAFFLSKHTVHWTSIFVLVYAACTGLIALGVTFFLSALSVFIRDVPSVTNPLSIVLMYISGVFFPIESLPPNLQIIFRANPLALIIDQARGAMLFGRIPSAGILLLSVFLSVIVAVAGYAFFMRSKHAFSDVM